MTLISLGQTVQQALRVQLSYEKAGQYLEQAVATIEAVNTVSASSTVEYRAGRSVTMLPGFAAYTGSVFIANIKSVSSHEEGDKQLQLTAFPNPFEQSTTIDFYLPAAGKVNLWVINTQGQIVGQLIQNEERSAGQHRIEWEPSGIDPGVYVPMLETNRQTVTSRLIKK